MFFYVLFLYLKEKEANKGCTLDLLCIFDGIAHASYPIVAQSG